MRRRHLGLLIASNVVVVWAMVGLGNGLRTACSAAPGWYSWLSQYIPYVCYSDLYTMWQGRQLYLHLPPYLVGTFSPPNSLGNGAVEYPVFSGVAMWLTAMPSQSYDDFFLVSTVVAGVLASIVAVIFVFLVGNWAYLWSFSPLLLLYASYNWDLYPVLMTVLGIAVVIWGPAAWSDQRRGIAASILFGIGCLFKLYPAFFVIPLAFWLALRHQGGTRARVGAAARIVGVCAGVVVAGNLPFALFGFEGWMGSLQFQGYRAISGNTMSIWYWWTLPFHHGNGFDGAVLPAATLMTSIAVFIGFALALWRGWWRWLREGDFPWVAVAGAMIVAYMLLGKVDSPQYALWVLPFLVVLTVPLWLSAVYTIANLLLYTAWFHPPFLAFLPWEYLVTPLLVTLNAAALVAVFIALVNANVRPLPNSGGIASLSTRFSAIGPRSPLGHP